VAVGRFDFSSVKLRHRDFACRLTSGAASDETPVQGEVPKQRSTLDDVLETIKLLEEEPQQLKESKPSRSVSACCYDEIANDEEALIPYAGNRIKRTNFVLHLFVRMAIPDLFANLLR